jgi:hypothetical protein
MNKIRILGSVLVVGAVVAASLATAGAGVPSTQYSAEVNFAAHPALGPVLHATAVALPGSTVPLAPGTRLHFTTTGSLTIGTHLVARIKPFRGTATIGGKTVIVKISTAERHLIRAAARRYCSTHVDLTTSTSVVGSLVRSRAELIFRIPGL